MTKEQLPTGIEREISPEELMNLHRLMSLCLEADVPFTISFDTGRYVPGEYVFYDDEESAKHVVQGPQGYRIEIGFEGTRGEDGKERLYSSIAEMFEAGLQLLYHIIAEDDCEANAIALFERYNINVSGPDT